MFSICNHINWQSAVYVKLVLYDFILKLKFWQVYWHLLNALVFINIAKLVNRCVHILRSLHYLECSFWSDSFFCMFLKLIFLAVVFIAKFSLNFRLQHWNAGLSKRKILCLRLIKQLCLTLENAAINLRLCRVSKWNISFDYKVTRIICFGFCREMTNSAHRL